MAMTGGLGAHTVCWRFLLLLLSFAGAQHVDAPHALFLGHGGRAYSVLAFAANCCSNHAVNLGMIWTGKCFRLFLGRGGGAHQTSQQPPRTVSLVFSPLPLATVVFGEH